MKRLYFSQRNLTILPAQIWHLERNILNGFFKGVTLYCGPYWADKVLQSAAAEAAPSEWS